MTSLEGNMIPDWMFGEIPDYMRDGMMRYIQHGIEPGSFLRAVLENDFYDAICRMDESNWKALNHYRDTLSYIPADSWGSKEKVAAWIRHRGMEGYSFSITRNNRKTKGKPS